MAHELGHNHGLQHAPCGNPWSDVDPHYPYAFGALGPQALYVGHADYTDALPGRTASPVDHYGQALADVMSYCPSTWFSDYSYNRAQSYAQGRAQAQATLGAWAASRPAEEVFSGRLTPSGPRHLAHRRGPAIPQVAKGEWSLRVTWRDGQARTVPIEPHWVAGEAESGPGPGRGSGRYGSFHASIAGAAGPVRSIEVLHLGLPWRGESP